MTCGDLLDGQCLLSSSFSLFPHESSKVPKAPWQPRGAGVHIGTAKTSFKRTPVRVVCA